MCVVMGDLLGERKRGQDHGGLWGAGMWSVLLPSEGHDPLKTHPRFHFPLPLTTSVLPAFVARTWNSILMHSSRLISKSPVYFTFCDIAERRRTKPSPGLGVATPIGNLTVPRNRLTGEST